MSKTVKRFPTAEEIVAEGGCVFPCANVMELCEAGLRNHELLIEHIWVEESEEDEDGDIMVWPTIQCSIRRVGTEEWKSMGNTEEGYMFTHCAGAGFVLMKWLGEMEDLIGDAAAELTYEDATKDD